METLRRTGLIFDWRVSFVASLPLVNPRDEFRRAGGRFGLSRGQAGDKRDDISA
jgi:hypothetical protein